MVKKILFVLILSMPLLFSCKAAKNGQQTHTSEPQLVVPSEPEETETIESEVMEPAEDMADAAPVYEEAVEEPDIILGEPVEDMASDESEKGADAADHDDPSVYFKLGVAYSNEGQYMEAIESYKNAARIIRSDYVIVHYNLGATYLMVNDRKAAFEEYKTLKGIDPQTADKLYNTAVQKAISDTDNRFMLQVGAYKNIAYAEEILEKLKSHFIYAYIEKGTNFNKVRVPGLNNRQEAEALKKDLIKKFGLVPYIIETSVNTAS